MESSSFISKKKDIIFITASFLVLAAIFIIYTTYNQKYVAASDWYGYYAGSQLLKKGRVAMEVELNPAQYPAIAPLSYFVWKGKVLPQYPPGYPLLMAFAGFAGLEFYVAPILGVLSVVLMFLLIKPLSNRWIAAFLASMWALFPIVVFGSTSVMSDLVATFFILLSLYLYRRGNIMLSAFSLAFSLAVRPTDLLYCLIFLPVLIRDKKWFKFGCYFAIPAFFYGLYNWFIYGAPWQTGYMSAAESFSSASFFPHLLFYARETFFQMTPFLILPALFALFRMSKERLFYASWFLIFFVFYCFWVPGGDCWWWTRFLLPGYPALFLLAALGFNDLWAIMQSKKKMKWKYAPRSTVAAFILLGIILGGYFINYGFHHQNIWEKNKGKFYYDITQKISNSISQNSYVGTIEFSGAIRLYTPITSFYLAHSNTKYLITNRLLHDIPVYLLIEPWNLKLPTVKQLFKLFRINKVLELDGWPNFYLYKVKNRILRVWRARGLL